MRHRSFWLLFAIVYPTLLTLTYFLWLKSSSPTLQQTVYAIGKLVQFGFPIAYVILTVGLPVRSQAFRSTGLGATFPDNPATKVSNTSNTRNTNLLIGVLFGIGVVAAMLGAYYFLLPEGLVAELNERVRARVKATGLDSKAAFLALSVFYVAIHSFLEEYYWRWFVFDQLQQSMTVWKANGIAALGFMAHHVVLLGTFFGWASPLGYLISLSVAVGGLFWAWLFNRQWGFRSSWISHAFVDAGIFGLGMAIVSQ